MNDAILSCTASENHKFSSSFLHMEHIEGLRMKLYHRGLFETIYVNFNSPFYVDTRWRRIKQSFMTKYNSSNGTLTLRQWQHLVSFFLRMTTQYHCQNRTSQVSFSFHPMGNVCKKADSYSKWFSPLCRFWVIVHARSFWFKRCIFVSSVRDWEIKRN